MKTFTITVELDDKGNIDHDPDDESDVAQYLSEVAEEMSEAIIETCHCFGMITVSEASTQTTYSIMDGRR